MLRGPGGRRRLLDDRTARVEKPKGFNNLALCCPVGILVMLIMTYHQFDTL